MQCARRWRSTSRTDSTVSPLASWFAGIASTNAWIRSGVARRASRVRSRRSSPERATREDDRRSPGMGADYTDAVGSPPPPRSPSRQIYANVIAIALAPGGSVKTVTLVTRRLYFGVDAMQMRDATARVLSRLEERPDQPLVKLDALVEDFRVSAAASRPMIDEMVRHGLLQRAWRSQRRIRRHREIPPLCGRPDRRAVGAKPREDAAQSHRRPCVAFQSHRDRATSTKSTLSPCSVLT